MTNTDKGESVSDTECPLPKRSQLRAARPHDADDQQADPTTSAIPMTDEASAPTPDPATDREDAEETPDSSMGERRRNVHPVGYVLRALLVRGLAGPTSAGPQTSLL